MPPVAHVGQMLPGPAGQVLLASAFFLAAVMVVGLGERWLADPARWRWELVVTAGALSGLVHLAVTAGHWSQDALYGAFFLATASVQLAVCVVLALRRAPVLLAAHVLLNLGLMMLWALTRTVGVPGGTAAGRREPVGLLDATAVVAELTVVVVGAALLSTRGRSLSAPRVTPLRSNARPWAPS